MECEIRPAHASDAPQLARIAGLTLSEAWSVAAFRALLERPRCRGLAAGGPQGLVGYVLGEILVDEVAIHSLAVSPGWQQHGLGRDRQSELFTAQPQPVHVVLPEPRLPADHGHGLEQAVAVLQAAVGRRNPVGDLAVHQALKHVSSPGRGTGPPAACPVPCRPFPAPPARLRSRPRCRPRSGNENAGR